MTKIAELLDRSVDAAHLLEFTDLDTIAPSRLAALPEAVARLAAAAPSLAAENLALKAALRALTDHDPAQTPEAREAAALAALAPITALDWAALDLPHAQADARPWCYSLDGEVFSAMTSGTRDMAVFLAADELRDRSNPGEVPIPEGVTVTVGRALMTPASAYLLDADTIIENLADAAASDFDSDRWPHNTPEQADHLAAFLAAATDIWAARYGLQPTWYEAQDEETVHADELRAALAREDAVIAQQAGHA